MKKKTFFILTLFISIIIISSISFAAETMNSMKNSINTLGKSTGNMVSSAAGALKNGVSDLSDGAQNVTENAFKTNNTDFYNNTNLDNIQESNYFTARTASTANTNNLLGLSTNSWLWIIMGIIGAIIVGLVWYYGAQYENNYNHNN